MPFFEPLSFLNSFFGMNDELIISAIYLFYTIYYIPNGSKTKQNNNKNLISGQIFLTTKKDRLAFLLFVINSKITSLVHP